MKVLVEAQKKRRVLVIDDKCMELGYEDCLPMVCEDVPLIEWCEFKDILSEAGAIEIINTDRPHVIILDGTIRGDFIGPNIAAYCQKNYPDILVISNSGDEGKFSLWQEAGVTHFAGKNSNKIRACLDGSCDCRALS
ncbi:MAG: hypothetical protein HYT13_02290 [Candidatus Liptonbacteria bacterium]|nr:hypothetical protein [Candidatus Liptonbacteria bacterium]